MQKLFVSLRAGDDTYAELKMPCAYSNCDEATIALDVFDEIPEGGNSREGESCNACVQTPQSLSNVSADSHCTEL